MSSYEHSRSKVVGPGQHPYKHTLSDFAYTNDATPPAVQNVEDALNYILAILYPKTLGTVALVADLPSAGNSAGDYYTVQDDGDGKYAGYTWLKYDGDSDYEWKKTHDVDWGIDGVLSELTDRTQPLFVIKRGSTDYDLDTGLALTGDNAGQHIFGGDLSDQHLTLHANNGDSVGNSGYIQLDDSLRPIPTRTDLTIGTAGNHFAHGYFDQVTIGTASLNIQSDATKTTLTDSNNEFDFGSGNIDTLGDITYANAIISGQITIAGELNLDETGLSLTTGDAFSFNNLDLTDVDNIVATSSSFGTLGISSGLITDTSGDISFDNENLTTTGNLNCLNMTAGGLVSGGALTIDTIGINNSKVTSTGNLELEAQNDTIKLLTKAESLGIDATGSITATDSVSVGSIGSYTTLGQGTLNNSSNEISTNSVLYPSASLNLGKTTNLFANIYMSGSIGNASLSTSIGTIISLRDILVDADANDFIKYDGTKFVAAPVASGDHTALLNINGGANGDGGHSVFPKLAGRTGGQIINGSDTTAESLHLRDNSVDNNGITLSGLEIYPTGDGAIDNGISGNAWKDVYVKGNVKVWNGLAYENLQGRKVFKDTAVAFNGSDLTKAVDVSASVDSANECIWQFRDTAGNNYEVLGVTITTSSTHVTISTSIALPAGNYTLMGIQT